MATDLAGGRVLVVDDDRVNRMLLTRSLEREGHRVRCAENGAEAWSCSTTTRAASSGSTSSCPGSTASRYWST